MEQGDNVFIDTHGRKFVRLDIESKYFYVNWEEKTIAVIRNDKSVFHFDLGSGLDEAVNMLIVLSENIFEKDPKLIFPEPPKEKKEKTKEPEKTEGAGSLEQQVVPEVPTEPNAPQTPSMDKVLTENLQKRGFNKTTRSIQDAILNMSRQKKKK